MAPDEPEQIPAAEDPAPPPVEVVPEGTGRVRPDQAIGPRHAFVVDASASMQLISSTLLRIAGFSVESFGSPAEAVKRSLDLRPDLMVVEPRSPGIDALATMRVLHEIHRDRSPVVVWCTTVVPEPDQVDEASRVGLRGVIIKPFRLEALTSLVLRVCRDEDRDRRLRELGVPGDQIASRSLDERATRLWVQVEGETVSAQPRPLSMVRVTAGGPEVGAAVRGALRSTDAVGRGPDGSLLVLLPDVDEAGAAAVAARLSRAVAGVDGTALVLPVTRRPAEEPVALLERSLPEVSPRQG
ncbi:MAG TPA: response regulator [Candidatus Dormibacteraeota bacterium]